MPSRRKRKEKTIIGFQSLQRMKQKRKGNNEPSRERKRREGRQLMCSAKIWNLNARPSMFSHELSTQIQASNSVCPLEISNRLFSQSFEKVSLYASSRRCNFSALCWKNPLLPPAQTAWSGELGKGRGRIILVLLLLGLQSVITTSHSCPSLRNVPALLPPSIPKSHFSG